MDEEFNLIRKKIDQDVDKLNSDTNNLQTKEFNHIALLLRCIGEINKFIDRIFFQIRLINVSADGDFDGGKDFSNLQTLRDSLNHVYTQQLMGLESIENNGKNVNKEKIEVLEHYLDNVKDQASLLLSSLKASEQQIKKYQDDSSNPKKKKKEPCFAIEKINDNFEEQIVNNDHNGKNKITEKENSLTEGTNKYEKSSFCQSNLCIGCFESVSDKKESVGSENTIDCKEIDLAAQPSKRPLSSEYFGKETCYIQNEQIRKESKILLEANNVRILDKDSRAQKQKDFSIENAFEKDKQPRYESETLLKNELGVHNDKTCTVNDGETKQNDHDVENESLSSTHLHIEDEQLLDTRLVKGIYKTNQVYNEAAKEKNSALERKSHSEVQRKDILQALAVQALNELSDIDNQSVSSSISTCARSKPPDGYSSGQSSEKSGKKQRIHPEQVSCVDNYRAPYFECKNPESSQQGSSLYGKWLHIYHQRDEEYQTDTGKTMMPKIAVSFQDDTVASKSRDKVQYIELIKVRNKQCVDLQQVVSKLSGDVRKQKSTIINLKKGCAEKENKIETLVSYANQLSITILKQREQLDRLKHDDLQGQVKNSGSMNTKVKTVDENHSPAVTNTVVKELDIVCACNKTVRSVNEELEECTQQLKEELKQPQTRQPSSRTLWSPSAGTRCRSPR